MLVQTLSEVPNHVFIPAMQEIMAIDWNTIRNNSTRTNSVFSTSVAINLRGHKVGDRPKPTTVEEWSVITECEDKEISKDYPLSYKAAEWIMQEVNGLVLGRIMIVNLLPKGSVALHIDPLDYFEMYSRYHIPFLTNPGVLFSSGADTQQEHMPAKHLSRLNNRVPHMVVNNSNEHRIHLIVDVATKDGNQIF